jgi:hypothetical protein
MAASLAKSFPIDASRPKGCLASARAAERHTINLAASTSVAMSASAKAMAWNSAIGLPKALRSLA